MHQTSPIAALRKELGFTLEQFGASIGIASKGNVSVIERSGRCSLAVALEIEKISGGRIKAETLNDDVAKVRRFESPSIALCGICQRSSADPAIRGCDAPDCPHLERDAA